MLMCGQSSFVIQYFWIPMQELQNEIVLSLTIFYSFKVSYQPVSLGSFIQNLISISDLSPQKFYM